MKKNHNTIEIVSSFTGLVSVLRGAYTTKNWVYVLPLMAAWIMLSASRTVTSLYKMSGINKYYSGCHRFFSEYRWDTKKAACKIMILCWKLMGKPKTIKLVCDDTICEKVGKKMFGVGVHSIKANKTQNKANREGHCWVVLGLLLEVEKMEKSICIPLIADLYVRKYDCKQAEQFKTRLQIAGELIDAVISGFTGEIQGFKGNFTLLADGSYGRKPVLMKTKRQGNIAVISILRRDMRLYMPNPSRNNKKAKHGKRLPTPAQLLRKNTYKRIKVSIYSKQRIVKVYTFFSYLLGYEGIVKVVIVAGYGKKPLNVFCTDTSMQDKEIIEEYAKRWSIEVMFHDSKQFMSFGRSQALTETALRKQTNFGLLAHALVELWYLKVFNNKIISNLDPWYKNKQTPSFADKLNTLRCYIAIKSNYQVWHLTGIWIKLKSSILNRFKRI